ncbi:MAG TPA: ATP-binding protein [Caulobacteraceae bacterium]|jgi:signal transduction histidine kinase
MGEAAVDLTELIAGLHGAVVVVDRSLTILDANEQWLKELRIPKAAAVGQNFLEVVPAAAQWSAGFERSLGGHVSKAAKVRLMGRNGRPFFFQSANIPWRDAAGDIAGLIIVTQILSDADVGEDAQRQSLRLETAVELAGIHVWEMDYEAENITAWGAADTFNEGAVGYAEFAADIGYTIHPADRERVLATWAAQDARGDDHRAEYRLKRDDDKLVWVQGSARYTYGADGQPTRMLGVLQNITDRKVAELDAEAANAAKSLFLATMSHEIRTPLNGVLGMAQAMAAGELTGEQRERLDVVRQSGETLLGILGDILDFSKIEAGKLDLETIDFDLEPVVRSALAPFTALAEAKGVTLDLDLNDAAGVYAGDPTRLRQILYNLTSNALKFTAAGEVRLSARRQGDQLELSVADTGIGIPDDKLAGLFDSFSQVDASTTRRFGGTGLGLAICRRLAELMGGRIAVASEPGQGSLFMVTLPLPWRGAAMPAAAPATAAAADVGALRVLAAEDNEVNRLVLKTLLHQVGVDPCLVENGEAALAAWRDGDWDLVLMDVQMPVMDGVAATRAIRAEEAARGYGRTPIVGLTANVMSHQVAEYLAAGMDAHVGKPISAAELFATIAEVMARDDVTSEVAA